MTISTKKVFSLMFAFLMFFGCIDANAITEDISDKDQRKPFVMEELSNIQSQNIYKLGKVWGFIKYYHPNVTKKDKDMDEELLKIVEKVYNCKSTLQGNNAIYRWVKSFGTAPKAVDNQLKKDSKIKISPDIEWIDNRKFLGYRLSNELKKVLSYKRDGVNKYVTVTGGAGNAIFLEDAVEDMNFEDDSMRLLGVFRYWNAVEYFFPYKYLTDKDWDDVLREYSSEVVLGNDYASYNKVMHHLVVDTRDDHSYLYKKGEGNLYVYGNLSRAVPFKMDSLKDGRVYVKSIASEGNLLDIQVGDVITAIDGKPIDEVVAEQLIKYPQNNNNHYSLRIYTMMQRSHKEIIPMEFLRDGESIALDIPTYKEKLTFAENEDSYEWIEEDIVYIHPSKLKSGEILTIMKEAEEKNADIILDLREYPSDFIQISMGNMILDKNYVFTQMTLPSISNPGEYRVIDYSCGYSNKNYFKGKLAVIIDKHSWSQPEFTAMAFRYAPGAKLIGYETNGADGNLSSISLPGNMVGSFSGIGVYTADGSETQRVGVKPDIEVYPTLKGIKEGRDELLERAIEYINE